MHFSLKLSHKLILNFVFYREYKSWKHIPDWDVALVELKKTIEFSDSISPICLPDADNQPLRGL